jgi:hypothetical protein
MKFTRRIAWRVIGIPLLFLGIQAVVGAHDVPNEIVIQTYIKPSGSQLKVLLRIPLLAVSDTNLPKDSVGYLAMPYLDPALREAANQIATGVVFLENDERLSQFELANARISLPSNKAFDTYDGALAHVRGPKLPDSTQLYYNQGYLDLELNYPIQSERADFGVQILLGKGIANQTVTFVNFARPDGAVRAFRLLDQTDVVRLDPSWRQAVWVFLTTGFYRFLDGLDHLLFLIVLVIPYRRVRDMVVPVLSFAAAHTLTLAAATFGLMPSGSWFPVLVSMLVAFSIVYVAIEDAVGANLRRRWMLAFGFGLAHGFGFAFALADALQFAGGHPLAALASFSIGLELGQVIILSITVPALALLFTRVVEERAGTILLSVVAGHAAWHWMADRFATLQLMNLPALDLALAATAVRWLLMLTIVGGGLWFLGGLLRRKPNVDEIPEKSIVDSR